MIVKLFLIEIFFSFLAKKSQSLFIIVEPRFGTGVLPQKRAGELYHRFHVDPSHGSIENCVLNSSSFNRTETLILNISFNYNYSSSSSPKPNAIYLGIFDLYSHSYQSIILFFGIFKDFKNLF